MNLPVPVSAKVGRPVARQDVSGLILAGGNGIRVGEGPKAFLRFGDKVLLQHAIEMIDPHAGELIVGVPAGHVGQAEGYIGDRPVRCVEGGETRQDTVGILTRAASRPFLIVQDVARPLTRTAHIQAALALVAADGAVVSALAATTRDGVAMREGDYYGKSLPRQKVILTQTPQAYRRDILLDAFAQAEANGWQEISPAALVANAGYSVRLLECSTENLKITYPGDLDKAYALFTQCPLTGANNHTLPGPGTTL